MGWLKVLDELDDRAVIEVEGKELLILRHDGALYAVENQCPHMHLPLEQGQVDGDHALHCPWHHSVFDLHSGEVKAWCTWPPGIGPMLGRLKRERELTTYHVREDDDGSIWVGVEE